MSTTPPLHLMQPSIIKDEVPERKGVYAYYNKQKELVFYGLAVGSLRKELLSDLHEKFLKKWARYFTFEETDYPIKRQKQLLLDYVKQHLTLPPCNEIEAFY